MHFSHTATHIVLDERPVFGTAFEKIVMLAFTNLATLVEDDDFVGVTDCR